MRISQQDPRWSRLLLGPSSLTVGGHGCTTCSISMGIMKLYPRSWQKMKCLPNDLVKKLAYTDDEHPLGGGLIIWGENKEEFKELGIEFVGRYSTFNAIDQEEAEKAARFKDKFVILEVATRSGGRHWLHCLSRSAFGWACENPWNGKMEWKTVGFGAPYSRVIGYAIFKRLVK